MVKRSTRKYNRRNRKSGGGWGFTGQSLPGVSNYGQVNTPMGDCRAQQPAGYISSYSGRGLPGLSGGANGNNNENQINGTGALASYGKDENELVANQSGGRYSFDLADPIPGSAAPWAGGIPTVQRIPCESAVHNPLNKQMGGRMTMKNVYKLQKRLMKKMSGMMGRKKGGKFSLRNVYGMKKRFTKRFSRNFKGLKKYAPNLKGLKKLTKTLKKRFTGRGGGLGTDSAAYYAPTAGYDNKPSSWLNSVGAPVQLQIPYEAKAWNPACLTTK